jgi:DNA-binding transcriptional LysR family regulator
MSAVPWDNRVRRRLKLRDLDILMAVIQAGGMGKAAARLDMSQPAVSKAVADLEHTLGVRLLDRSRHGVTPTRYGLALIKRGVVVFNELRQGVQDIEFLADPTAGELRIGATEPIAAAIVAPIINQFMREYPRMAFHVVRGDAMVTHFPNLADRNIELLISRIGSAVPKEYSTETLFHDTVVVVTGVNNPLTRRRKIELAELVDEPWILQLPNQYFGSLVPETFRASGCAPPRLTVSTSSAILRNELLANGRFLTALPEFSLRLPGKHPWLRALPVELPKSRHPIAIITLKDRSLSPLAQLFIERVRVITKPLAKAQRKVT